MGQTKIYLEFIKTLYTDIPFVCFSNISNIDRIFKNKFFLENLTQRESTEILSTESSQGEHKFL
jgi:hypothetical protein